MTPPTVALDSAAVLTREGLHTGHAHAAHQAAPAPAPAEFPQIPGATVIPDARLYHEATPRDGDIRTWVIRADGAYAARYDWGRHVLCAGITGYNNIVNTVDYVAGDGQRTSILTNCPANYAADPNTPHYYWRIPCSTNYYYGGNWYGLGQWAWSPSVGYGSALAWYRAAVTNNAWSPGGAPPSGYTYPKLGTVSSAVNAYLGEGTFTKLPGDKIAYRVPSTKALLINYFTGTVEMNGIPLKFDQDEITRPNYNIVFGSNESITFKLTGTIHGYTCNPALLKKLGQGAPHAK